jgi:drug/metabolite transporter (DMT)-like permease
MRRLPPIGGRLVGMMKRIVWSAVAAAALAAAAVVLAVLDYPSESLAVGLAAVTAALLANRERG